MAIHTIYLGRGEVADRWIWPTTRGGVVTPRLVYRQLREEARAGGTESDRDEGARREHQWAKLWKGTSAPKVKSFIWQAGHQKDVAHALLGCEWVRRA